MTDKPTNSGSALLLKEALVQELIELSDEEILADAEAFGLSAGEAEAMILHGLNMVVATDGHLLQDFVREELWSIVTPLERRRRSSAPTPLRTSHPVLRKAAFVDTDDGLDLTLGNRTDASDPAGKSESAADWPPSKPSADD